MNDRIIKSGIEISGIWISYGKDENGKEQGHWTIDGKEMGAYLSYNGKKIIRPSYDNCEEVIFREFGIRLIPEEKKSEQLKIAI